MYEFFKRSVQPTNSRIPGYEVGEWVTADCPYVLNRRILGKINLMIRYPEQIFIETNNQQIYIIDTDSDIVKIESEEELMLARLTYD